MSSHGRLTWCRPPGLAAVLAPDSRACNGARQQRGACRTVRCPPVPRPSLGVPLWLSPQEALPSRAESFCAVSSILTTPPACSFQPNVVFQSYCLIFFNIFVCILKCTCEYFKCMLGCTLKSLTEAWNKMKIYGCGQHCKRCK